MSNKFIVTKYAAVASAVALACGAAIGSASSIDNGATKLYSTRNANLSAASTAGTVFPADASITLSANYAANDTIAISISRAEFQTTTATGTPTLVCAATGSASTLLAGFVSKTASTLTFRVTGGTGLDKSGFSCVAAAAGMSLARSSMTSTSSTGITLALASSMAGTGTSFDTFLGPAGDGLAANFGRTYDQFTAVVTAGSGFSGTVSVATNRLGWGSTTTSRSLIVSLESTNTGGTGFVTNAMGAGLVTDDASNTFTINVYNATVGGPAMFAWLDDDQNGCTADDLTVGPGSASASGGTLSISANCATLTITGAASLGNTTPKKNVTLTLSKASVSAGLPIQFGRFEVASSFASSVTNAVTQAGLTNDGGTFAINGALINIPYLPYGNSGTTPITRAIYATNTSTSAGVVTGTARNEAGVVCNMGTLGTLAASSVTNLSTAIDSAIATCYGTGGVVKDGTRVYIDLVSNTAQASTIINATYNVGGNRVQVVNDSMQIRNLKADGTLN